MKLFKKLMVLVMAVVMAFAMFGLVGCGKPKDTFLIVGLQGGRGETYINNLVTEFKKTHSEKEIEVKLFPSATVQTEVTNLINTGSVPDLMFLNPNMSGATLVETFVKDKSLLDVSSLLTEKVAGEDVTVEAKLVGGLLNNYTCQPYGDGKTYLLPAFYSPTGFFYDADRFYTGDTEVAGKFKLPTNLVDFFALGDELNTARATAPSTPHLFTYPTAGYFDGVIYPMIAAMAGDAKYMKALGYADGIWQDADVKTALKQIVTLKNYLEPNTVAQANKEGFTKNQQAVIGTVTVANDVVTKTAPGTALFIPNGDWLPGEMSKTTPADFKWGFTTMAKKDATSTAYTNTFIETMFVHKDATDANLAKEFIKLYYSDAGAKIVATANKAIIPTKAALVNAAANGVPAETINLYNVFGTASSVVGNFVATKPVADVVWSDILFNTQIDEMMKSSEPIDAIVNSWSAKLEAASDKLRAAII